MKFLLIIVALATTACGASWTESDKADATNAARLSLAAEAAVSDGGVPNPAQTRALERGAFCANADMLFNHKEPVPDGGTKCQAP